MIDGNRGRSRDEVEAGPESGPDGRGDVALAPVGDGATGASGAADRPVVDASGDLSGPQAGWAGEGEEGRVAPRRRLPRIELGRRLVALGVRADYVTVLGVLIAAVTGWVIATGHLLVGVALVTTGGLMDTLDGAVAKAAGTSSKRGAFFDSVTDRVADGLIFGGVAWYFAAGPGRDPKLAILPLAILGVGNVISYERAKAESLGYVAKGGLMERAERLILLGLALVFHWVLVPVLWALLGLCILTAAQRFVKVWRQASADLPTAASAHLGASDAQQAGVDAGGRLGGASSAEASHARAWRPGRVESRWREWREATASNGRPRVATGRASRGRSRRRDEPLSIRVRRMLGSELGAEVGSRPAFGRGQRKRHERAGERAAAAFRRRLGTGR